MVPGIEQLIGCLHGRFDEILNPRWVSTQEGFKYEMMTTDLVARSQPARSCSISRARATMKSNGIKYAP